MTISYEQAGDPANPTLVLMHGIGGDAISFGPQLESLAKDWHVVAWNMPGYGASRLPESMTFEVLGDSVNAHILGHSIGGMVAQQFVAEYPERVRTLILSGTSPAFGKSDGDFQKKFIAARLGPLEAGKTMSELADGIVESLVGDSPNPAGVEIARGCMGRVPGDTYRAAMHCLVTFDRRDNLGKITAPTLLIAGEKDNNAPPKVMEKMAGYIPGAEYVCISGAGHLANLERPTEFNNIVSQFLARHSGVDQS